MRSSRTRSSYSSIVTDKMIVLRKSAGTVYYLGSMTKCRCDQSLERVDYLMHCSKALFYYFPDAPSSEMLCTSSISVMLDVMHSLLPSLLPTIVICCYYLRHCHPRYLLFTYKYRLNMPLFHSLFEELSRSVCRDSKSHSTYSVKLNQHTVRAGWEIKWPIMARCVCRSF